MFRTFANAWKTEDLRKKILFTLFIILIYRIGACLPLPFITVGGYAQVEGVLQLVNIFSGGAFEQGTLFALGVSPYITSSIVIQLLTVAIPALERLAQQGDEGRKKITAITRYATVIIALINAVAYYFLLRNYGLISTLYDNAFFAIVIISCYCAGSAIVMWIAEKINDKGIGNGISIILFANIIARVRPMFLSIIDAFGLSINKDATVGYLRPVLFTLAVIVVMLAMIWFIIFISDSERRIPVQYAKKVVGRKMYGGQNTNLPIKLNMTGVMPFIFASSILQIMPTILGVIDQNKGLSEGWTKVYNFFNNITWYYALIMVALIIAFAYFYAAISFNPVEVAGNLQKNGGTILGIRPGKPTSDYIAKVLSRVTFIGAVALAIVAVVPYLFKIINNVFVEHSYVGSTFYANLNLNDIVFSGTSVIILVGVILETVRELEGQMTMRHYKGFLD